MSQINHVMKCDACSIIFSYSMHSLDTWHCPFNFSPSFLLSQIVKKTLSNWLNISVLGHKTISTIHCMAFCNKIERNRENDIIF